MIYPDGMECNERTINIINLVKIKFPMRVIFLYLLFLEGFETFLIIF